MNNFTIGDPICSYCGKYVAWCGGCEGRSYSPLPLQLYDPFKYEPSFSRYPADNSTFYINQIKALEQEIEKLTEENLQLRSMHAEDCELFKSKQIKCNCSVWQVK